MKSIDVFLCYRRAGAQTAKLFKRYLANNNFPGEVWYSDLELLGNYKKDVSGLLSESECAVIFIDQDFVRGFEGGDSDFECITAQEIVAIAKCKQQNDSYRLFTIYLDRDQGLSKEESKVLLDLFRNENIENPEGAVLFFSQNNMIFFRTSVDEENDLFESIERQMLPNGYYENSLQKGNFYFGKQQTTVDMVVWDRDGGIFSENICFELTMEKNTLHDAIGRRRARLEYEIQNNRMVSLVRYHLSLTDNDEKKKVLIQYGEIDYSLFSATIQMRSTYEIDKWLFKYRTDSDEVFPVPNAMGLAFMVITGDMQMVFTKRSTRRRIRSGEYDVSIVEGLKLEGIRGNGSEYDISSNDYLEQEIIRSFNEEICEANEIDYLISGLSLDRAFGQWNVIGVVRTMLTAKDISAYHSLRDDTAEDNQLLFIPLFDHEGNKALKDIARAIKGFRRVGFWDMGLSTLYAALRKIGFVQKEIDEMSTLI